MSCTRLNPQARVAPEGREAARRFVYFDTLFVQFSKITTYFRCPKTHKTTKASPGVQDLEETFCEKREIPQICRIRLILPGTDKSKSFDDFGIPKNPTRDKCLPAGTQKSRYRCLYPWVVRAEFVDTQTNTHKPFETIIS